MTSIVIPRSDAESEYFPFHFDREAKDTRFLPEKVSTKAAKELFEHFQKIEFDYKHQLSGLNPFLHSFLSRPDDWFLTNVFRYWTAKITFCNWQKLNSGKSDAWKFKSLHPALQSFWAF